MEQSTNTIRHIRVSFPLKIGVAPETRIATDVAVSFDAPFDTVKQYAIGVATQRFKRDVEPGLAVSEAAHAYAGLTVRQIGEDD